MKLRSGRIVAAALVAAFLPRFFPQLLAFPYHAHAGDFEVWSEAPIDQSRLDGIVADATRRIAASPLYRVPERRKLFLTDGGWRWHWLGINLTGSFAFSPPLTNGEVFNRSSLTENAVWNGRSIGGQRSLSGTIAHETCHEMERQHFGLLSDWSKPNWLREGYCDYVAQESSLSDVDYAALQARNASHPAMAYLEGRRRVAAELAANGGNVDALFAAH